MNRFVAPWYLLSDFRAGLRDEAHQSRRETYGLVRHAYLVTRGASRRILRSVYGKLRPVRANQELFPAPVLEALRRDGIASPAEHRPPSGRRRTPRAWATTSKPSSPRRE
jgi:hypothetical protein